MQVSTTYIKIDNVCCLRCVVLYITHSMQLIFIVLYRQLIMKSSETVISMVAVKHQPRSKGLLTIQSLLVISK